MFESGRVQETDTETFEIVEEQLVGGEWVFCIGRKRGMTLTDLRSYYSSHEARITHQVNRLINLQRDIDVDIDWLQAGGDPGGCIHLR